MNKDMKCVQWKYDKKRVVAIMFVYCITISCVLMIFGELWRLANTMKELLL